MQGNINKVRLDKALNTVAILLLFFVFFASLVLALCAPLFTSNGVASAIDVTLPDDGVVGFNWLRQSSNFSSLSSDWSSNLSWTSFNDGILTFDNSTTSTVYPYQKVNTTVAVDDIVTISCYVTDIIKPVYIWLRNVSTTNLSSTNQLSLGLNFVTYRITKGGAPQFAFSIPAGSKVSLKWIKFEKGSSFTGYVPDYQNNFNDLQIQYDNLQNTYDNLQTQYNDLLNSMDFSTFNSVDLNSTKPFVQSTTTGNAIGSSTTTASYYSHSYGGYWYYRNSVEKDPFSLALCEFDIGSTLLAGSDIKISYDALFPYNGTFADNVGVVLTFSNYGFYSDASNLKGQYVFIPASDFIGKEFIYNFDFDVNYISFGVGTFDSSSNTFSDITLGYNVNSSVKQGVFISNFVVKGRGSNFNVAIDNANKQGYNKGYQEGKIAGKEVGYQLGVKDQGDYSFMGLIGAVFDAPVQAFKGLLNFEILGVDMTAFVSSLFALAIIVVIIKISLGGK